MAIAARQMGTEGFTVEDVLAMPEDGLRYELFDGMLIVNPPPVVRHQLAVMNLLLLLQSPHELGLQTLPGPIGFRSGENRWFEPDLVVVPVAGLDTAHIQLPETPVLVVEVLSPSSRTYDRTIKLQAYDEGGVEAYWVVDPATDTPSVTVYARTEAGGPLVVTGRSDGEMPLELEHPWPLRIVAANLIK